MLPATTRRRRDDAEAATAGESLQVPGALTVAAGPRCPHSRCSPPSGLTVVAAHNPQARPAAKQSLQPPKPSQCRCSPQAPLSRCTYADPHNPRPSQPRGRPGAPHSRCSLADEPKQSLHPGAPHNRGALTVAASRVPCKQSLQPPSALHSRRSAPVAASQALCSPSSRCSPQVPLTVAAGFRPPHSSRCIPQVPLTVAAAPQAVTVAAASRARIAVRIEAGRDGDDAATTGR